MFRYYFALLLINCGIVWCLFEQCNHRVELKTGQKIYINSPYYPDKYPLGSSCRYTLIAPRDHVLKFKCNIELNSQPSATRCDDEIFYFNREGSELLSGSEYFCGSGNVERKSFLNRAVISYISKPIYRSYPPSAMPELETSMNKTHNENVNDDDDDYGNGGGVEIAVEEDDGLLAQDVEHAIPYAGHSFNSKESTSVGSSTTTTTKTTTAIISPTTTTTATAFTNLLDAITWRNSSSSVNTPSRAARIIAGNSFGAVGAVAGVVAVAEESPSAAVARIVADVSHVARPLAASEGGGSFTCLVEVLEPVCECGWSVGLKVAGDAVEAGINEFPSMAGVMTVKHSKIFCGATIIHHRYLISAAHCFITPETERANLIKVVVGEHDLSTVFESVYTRTYDIDAIIMHEHFRSTATTVRNDIALLRTRLDIDWNRSVGPACLPFRTIGGNDGRKPPLPGQRLDTAGWGTTSFGGAQSQRLLKTTLDVIATDQCKRTLGGSLAAATFCTFTPGRDTCQYDSGGALYARSERLFAVGIVSYGFACASNQPSVNTKISSFLRWIKTKTPGVKYCVK